MLLFDGLQASRQKHMQTVVLVKVKESDQRTERAKRMEMQGRPDV